MRFFIFVFWLCCFLPECVAYNIEPCLEQYTNNPKITLNLVFCPLNYRDNEDFIKDTEVFVERLRNIKPFDGLSGLKILRINLTKQEAAQIFKPTESFPPLKVRNDFLVDISAILKFEYKLVIIDAQSSLSCAELSSIDKTSLVILGKLRYEDNNSFAKGFLHELGHSLGLRDECARCPQLSPPGYPNCASTKEEAEKWWGDLAGNDPRVNYISGCCGNKDYIRPTIASLMNDLDKAEDFGPVNERYLRKVLNRP